MSTKYRFRYLESIMDWTPRASQSVGVVPEGCLNRTFSLVVLISQADVLRQVCIKVCLRFHVEVEFPAHPEESESADRDSVLYTLYAPRGKRQSRSFRIYLVRLKTVNTGVFIAANVDIRTAVSSTLDFHSRSSRESE